MNSDLYIFSENEEPLERFVNGVSNTAIFRTIGFIGDSLSSGEFESRDSDGAPGYHDMFEYSWGQYIARKNGLTAYNFSRGGMTAKEYVESFADANGFWDPGKACQAYVIALGVNDVLNMRQEVGSVANFDAEHPENSRDTFAGYYSRIIARLKAIQPRAKFFLVTMPKGGDATDGIKAAHAKLLYDIAGYFGNSYVIDLYKYAPVYDENFRGRYFLYGHMNAAGYIFTANMVDAYIDYIVRHNPEDFNRVPFIGTDLK